MGDLNLDVINDEVSKVISIAEINKNSDFLVLVNTNGLTQEQAAIYCERIKSLVVDYKNHKNSNQSFLVIPTFSSDCLRVSPIDKNSDYIITVNHGNLTQKQKKSYFSYLKECLTAFCKGQKTKAINQKFLVLPVTDNDAIKITDIAKLSDDDLAKYGLKKL